LAKEPKPASGRFVLRIDSDLHASLRAAAAAMGTSLNDFCARKLAAPGALPVALAWQAVGRAVDVVGEALDGLVVFGSWARQQTTEDSDVDLLVVVESSLKVDRGLYRAWDSAPLTWEGRPVEPHFVHLPEAGSRLTGLWAEVALEGIVLFDRSLNVSRRLSEFRREIVSGRIRHRQIHGQPYWVGET
jgi:predicted nucleotidyltransferase